MRTVLGSTATTSRMEDSEGPLSCDVRWRSRLSLTPAPASSGVPSWKVTPSRTTSVQLSRSVDSSSDSARRGSAGPSKGATMSVSYRALPMLNALPMARKLPAGL